MGRAGDNCLPDGKLVELQLFVENYDSRAKRTQEPRMRSRAPPPHHPEAERPARGNLDGAMA